MSNRLDQEREARLQPKRVAKAKKNIEALGYAIKEQTETTIKFYFQTQIVTYYPYSGWHTGKNIKDGRGWKNLYNQIKN